MSSGKKGSIFQNVPTKENFKINKNDPVCHLFMQGILLSNLVKGTKMAVKVLLME
jgi:hypothetical protein